MCLAESLFIGLHGRAWERCSCWREAFNVEIATKAWGGPGVEQAFTWVRGGWGRTNRILRRACGHGGILPSPRAPCSLTCCLWGINSRVGAWFGAGSLHKARFGLCAALQVAPSIGATYFLFELLTKHLDTPAGDCQRQRSAAGAAGGRGLSTPPSETAAA